MVAATKSRRTRKPKRDPVPPDDWEVGETISAETTERSRIDRSDVTELIATEDLHDHPANPSSRVASEAITELAQSIGVYGQREVVRVRPVDAIRREDRPEHGYEILSGHRRVAACRMLGLSVRCEVVDCDDNEALREVMLGNAERSDLNPIQRAELMQEMIDAGIDRLEAGKMFGLGSESGVKNTLRLLEFPKSMQAIVADGTLPVRSARYAIPYAAALDIIEGWAKEIRKDQSRRAFAARSPERYFEINMDGQSDHRTVHCRPMDGRTKYQPSWNHQKTARKFPLEGQGTDIKARLHVVDLPLGKDGKLVSVATNVKLFDKLNAPFLELRDPYAGGIGKAKSTKIDPKKATPQQLAAETRRKAAEAKKQLEKKSKIWARRFRLQCLARQTPMMHPVILSTLPWWISRSGIGTDSRDGWIESATNTLGCKVSPLLSSCRSTAAAIACSYDCSSKNGSITIPPGYAVVDRLWRILVWAQRLNWPCGEISEQTDERVPSTLPVKLATSVEDWSQNDDEIQTMLTFADVSIGGGWRDLVDDPPDVSMLVEFLNLHTSDQLSVLAKNWKVDIANAKKKTDKVAVITAAHTSAKPLPLPACLQEKPKRKGSRK